MTIAAAFVIVAALALPQVATGGQSKVAGDSSIPRGAAPRPAEITASELMHWLDTHPNARAGGVSVDANGQTVTVAWKGVVPQAFRRLAGAQPARVRFVSAPFSAAELTAEARRI